MKALYIDGEAGAAGDMLLGAMIDLGVDTAQLTEILKPLIPSDFSLHVESVSLYGIAAKRLKVQVVEQPGHRHLKQVLSILDRGDLAPNVRKRAGAVFRRLAEAEARIHSSTLEKVHFHEVGADDAIIDIVGVIWSLDALGVDSVYCAPLTLGSGVGRSAHGPIHYPAPAVLQILDGCPTRRVDGLGETTTPTGAAILAEVAEFTTELVISSEAVGYGAGTRNFPDRPNLLRATLGRLQQDWETDQLWVATSDIDNTRPEVFEWVEHRLRDAGAVDVLTTDIGMKKSRRGTRLEVLCISSDRSAIAEIILTETASLGVRWHSVLRTKLPRTIETVETEWGPIRVKVARTAYGPRAVPEYDDCRAAAVASGVPLLQIIETAQRIYVESAGDHCGTKGIG